MADGDDRLKFLLGEVRAVITAAGPDIPTDLRNYLAEQMMPFRELEAMVGGLLIMYASLLLEMGTKEAAVAYLDRVLETSALEQLFWSGEGQ